MNNRGEILDALFGLCPSERFDRHISGRRPNNRIRSTLPHPQVALELLRRRFSEAELIGAKIARPDPFGELRLVPEVCQANGVILAFRNEPSEPAYELLTTRGTLGGRHAVIAALDDGRRRVLVEETGLMLAAHRILDVAILDSLDLPATLGFGLAGLGLEEFRELDALYGEGLPVFGVKEQAPKTPQMPDDTDAQAGYWQPLVPDASAALRPTLILMDGLNRRRALPPSSWLQNTTRWFTDVRRHVGLTFAGIWVWQPADGFDERLEFAYRMRDRALIREVVLQSMTSLVDFEACVGSASDPSAKGPSYLTTRRGLMKQLTAWPMEEGARQDQLSDSMDDYEWAVQHELVEPLIAWATRNVNPVVRSAGAQLADIVALLHRMAPRLHAGQVQHLAARCSTEDRVWPESGLLEEYMRLLDRFSRLSGEIAKWMKT